MQSRPAAERPSRLSLLPLVRDLDEAAAGQPAEAPSGPKSQMEWDEEETPPRAQEKVRELFREVMYRHKRQKAAAAKATATAKVKASQEANDSPSSTTGHRSSDQTKEERKGGSIRNARNGIESRRKLEVSFPSAPQLCVHLLTMSWLSSLRAYDELMLPLAFAAQRALPTRRVDTKQTQQETSWPKRLAAKASVRSLKSKNSFASLTRRAAQQSEVPPPVPPIPSQYATGPQEAVNASPREAISPFLAFERYAPAKKTPTTPSSSWRRLKALGSTTTVNTTVTTPSSAKISIPEEDPFWDDSVARVREIVRKEQEEERRKRKASTKAERRFIRNVSRDREGRFKYAKLTIDALIGKYDEHGWLPKKEPKNFDDDDWKFVLEVLDHEDTRALRDRLFQKPEWVEADIARRLRFEEAMRTNPTPEYLAAQKANRDKARKEYAFRKQCGMLTKEEKERDALEESSPVGLGISNTTVPLTPQITRTSKSSKTTEQSSQSANTLQTISRGRPTTRLDHGTPSRFRGDATGNLSTVRDSVEQMTGVFNTEGFDPRLSRLGSEEIKQYIRKKSSTRSQSPTPMQARSHVNRSLDPRQRQKITFAQGTPSRSGTPKLHSQAVKTVASTNDLLEDYARRHPQSPFDDGPSPTLPTLGIHPTFRGSQTSPIPQSATLSQIPKLRKVRSSIAPPAAQPPKPRKPSSAVKSPSEPTPSSPLALTSSSSPIAVTSPSSELGPPRSRKLTKNAPPLIRKPSTSVKTPRSASDPAKAPGPVWQQEPPKGILNRLEKIKANLVQPKVRPPIPQIGVDNSKILEKKNGDSEHSGKAHAIAQKGVNNSKPLEKENEVSEYYGKSHATPQNATKDEPSPTLKRALVASLQDEQRRTASLPLYQPIPRSLARLSRIPTMPDAREFLAVMGPDDSELPAHTTSSPLTSPSPTPTPRDRLTAMRSGTPVTVVGTNARGGYEPVARDFSIASPTTLLPTFNIGRKHPTANVTSMPSQAPPFRIGAGRWEVIPLAAQQPTDNAIVSPIEDAHCRIDFVKDLTHLTPAEQAALTARVPTPSSPMASRMPVRVSHTHDQQIQQRMPKTQGLNVSGNGGRRNFTENVKHLSTIAASSASRSERSVSLGNDRSTGTSEVEANIDDAINAWQQSSPLPSAQSHNSLGSFNGDQEIQILRSEIGLEPIREHIPGNAKHPNHHHTWNTKKIMCRRIHNPGVILPSLPSPTPGQPANMAEYASEFFMGSPYTNEPTRPERCAKCGSSCCHFAELSFRPQKRTTDIIELNKIRRNAEAVAKMRTSKPNGVEEWDAFLECSQCERSFCPDCIMLCSEELCQEPVCVDCRQGLELCRIHNVF
jgi:hypothetical protein